MFYSSDHNKCISVTEKWINQNDSDDIKLDRHAENLGKTLREIGGSAAAVLILLVGLGMVIWAWHVMRSKAINAMLETQ